jgi:HK97 family phage major capsid protein
MKMNMGKHALVKSLAGLSFQWLIALCLATATSVQVNPEPGDSGTVAMSVRSEKYLHHQDHHAERCRYQMSSEILSQVKVGVEGMIAAQKHMDSRLSDVERTMGQTKRKSWEALSLPNGEEFSFRKALAIACYTSSGQLGQHKELLNSHEFRIMSQATTKAMDSSTGGAGGGYTIPSEYLGKSFIEMQRANSVVLQAGATLLENLNGSPVLIPKQLTSATVSWIGQNQTITATDPSFGQVSLTPHTMAMRSQYSNLLNILANPAMEQILRKDFAKVAALELDRVALRGSGAANQPLGVNGVSGLGTYAIGTNGGDLTRQDLLKMAGIQDDNNAMGGKMAYVMHTKVKRVLKNERIAQFSGQTIGEYTQYPLSDSALAKSLDFPVFSTTQIPINLTKGSSTDCSEVYFGNWEELLIGIWGGLEILATNIGGNAWAQNAIEVRLIQNVDIGVRHGQSFTLCNDARVNNA